MLLLMEAPSIFTVLYRLAARATGMPRATLQDRLMVGIANHYGALGCALHTDAAGWAASKADPALEVAKLSRLDRARLETIEARLVKEVVLQQQMKSVLDLEDGSRLDEFLAERLGLVDIFAFPLERGGKPYAVLVLHLGPASKHLGELDTIALSTLGELMDLASPS